MTANPTALRYPQIDALRGLAALLVVWIHASQLFLALPSVAAQDTSLFDLAEQMTLGKVGVFAFFAISGFVIPPTVGAGDGPDLRRFLLKRVCRLYPAFWLALLVSVGVYTLHGNPLPPPLVWLGNLTMIPTGLGQPPMFGHLWTLEIEWLFYGCVMLLASMGLLRRQLALTALVCGLVALHIVNAMAPWSTAPQRGHWSHIPYALAVMLWASQLRLTHDPDTPRLIQLRRWLTQPWVWSSTLAILAGGLNLGALAAADLPHLSDPGPLRGVLLFLLVVVTVRRAPHLLVQLGMVSYSLYLLNPAVITALLYWPAFTPNGWWAQQPLWVHVMTSCVASIVVATLVYRWVERPCIRLGNAWAAHQSRPAGVTPHAP